ncbi:hypothetical protein [Haloechinothrix sp. LS1_15]|uniref:hypothetical protein n=1 Tax=Haloechinothrix sp. LS1_15 TaxID=2652248 RepID=UPI0029445023|nr:hypothetical protein [Haloechinothrix sp. LS1_15]MDV6014424.1 hypothetical protein [Haloechinothrix sp. LS1_15]
MTDRTRFVLRWLAYLIGGALVVAMLGASAYARYGGETVGDRLVIPPGDTDTRFLVSTASIPETRECTFRSPGHEPRTLTLPRQASRNPIVRGEYVEPPPEGMVITCGRGEWIQATSGPVLTLYPLFRADGILIMAGIVIVVVARVFLGPPRKPRRRAGPGGSRA